MTQDNPNIEEQQGDFFDEEAGAEGADRILHRIFRCLLRRSCISSPLQELPSSVLPLPAVLPHSLLPAVPPSVAAAPSHTGSAH